jgi:hypothetical protein
MSGCVFGLPIPMECMFKLSIDHLELLFRLNEFPIGNAAMTFVGLRGCLPARPFDQTHGAQHELQPASVDYLHPRCTLIQWEHRVRRFAVFPGSTVPHRRSVVDAQKRGGTGANQMMTGYFTDYRKGWHRKGMPTGHEAWRQNLPRPIRRTTDDPEYDELDRLEIANPADNLHAAWCAGIRDGFSSAGCQVVVGYPACVRRGSAPATGPWKIFKDRGYASRQTEFHYALFLGTDAMRLVASGPAGLERVRYGSFGARAKLVQQALMAEGFYEGCLDGRFASESLRALLAFQTAKFGIRGGDGVCGPKTARALGVKLE